VNAPPEPLQRLDLRAEQAGVSTATSLHGMLAPMLPTQDRATLMAELSVANLLSGLIV
jgi:hypothetical protein